MWWRQHPHLWAIHDQGVHVHEVKKIRSFGPERIELLSDRVKMVIAGTGLEIANWDGETMEIRGQVIRVEWG